MNFNESRVALALWPSVYRAVYPLVFLFASVWLYLLVCPVVCPFFLSVSCAAL